MRRLEPFRDFAHYYFCYVCDSDVLLNFIFISEFMKTKMQIVDGWKGWGQERRVSIGGRVRTIPRGIERAETQNLF